MAENALKKPAKVNLRKRRPHFIEVNYCSYGTCKSRGKHRHNGFWFCLSHFPPLIESRAKAQLNEEMKRAWAASAHQGILEALQSIAAGWPNTEPGIYAALRLNGLGYPVAKANDPDA